MIAPPRLKPSADAPRVAWIRPSKLIWLPVVIATFAYVGESPPHLLWEYRWTGTRDNPVYSSCDYVGRFSQRYFPRDGKCPAILFLKEKRYD